MSQKRVILITGGGSGIGRATARKFSAAGEHVVIADINESSGYRVVDEIKSANGDAEYVSVDVANDQSVAAMANEVNDRHGHIDVLVNCAGILQNISKAEDMDLEEHDRVWAVNYRGTYLCCQSIGTIMSKQTQPGSIVNISSTSAARAFPLVAYGPGKAAIDQLPAILSADLGPSDVRVNAVMPGYVLTEQMQARIDAGHRDPAKMNAQSAIGRMILPSEIADAIYFLCSDDARAINGVVLPIDGGWLPYVTYMQHPGWS